MNRAAVVLAILLLATAARAGLLSMHFDPPVSDPLHSVDAVIYAFEGCILIPAGHTVERDGSTLRIHVSYASGTCLSVPSAWRYVVPLGTLPAGTYDVVVSLDFSTRTLEQTLIIREPGSVSFSVRAVPINGGAINVCCGVSAVSFGGGPFVQLHDGVVNAPPHAAGTVDLTIQTFDNGTQTRKAAITYYDPAAPPDLALFEPILFPIAYNGGGAYGSRWATENTLQPALLLRSPASLDASRPEGLLLWAFRGTHGEFDAQSRIRETARDDMGIEVPVVRERDFRRPDANFQGLRILRIPVRANARYTLRVYALGDPGILRLDFSTKIPMSKTNTEGLWFAAIDVTDSITGSKTTSADLTVSGDLSHDVPYWAMVSITDNATQQVTIVSPQ